MATFIRFRRAFAAHKRALLAGALALSANCARPPFALISEAPTSTLVRRTPTSKPANPAPEDASTKAFDSGGALALEPPQSPKVELSFEDASPSDAHPRAKDPMQASLDDEELARWNLGGSSDPNYTSSRASFHPGTRVVVDTELTRRRTKPRQGGPFLSAERVQAQARSAGYWPFRACFEIGQRERKGSGGVTRIAFSIGTHGTVTSARLLSSQLGNVRSAACLLAELRKLRFVPRPAERVNVLASISLWPGDVELPPTSTLPLAAYGSQSDNFDPSAVRARLLEQQPALSACFKAARRSDEHLWGRLALSVDLEIDGSVHRVSEVESHFPSAAAARCAASAIGQIVFPGVNGKPFSFVLAIRLAPPAERAPDVVQLDAGLPAQRPDDTQVPSD